MKNVPTLSVLQNRFLHIVKMLLSALPMIRKGNEIKIMKQDESNNDNLMRESSLAKNTIRQLTNAVIPRVGLSESKTKCCGANNLFFAIRICWDFK